VFPFSRSDDRFDVIFLRNVMLYFSQETRRALLEKIHRVLTPDGILFLGSSEQPADPSIWTSVLAGGTCHLTPILLGYGGRESASKPDPHPPVPAGPSKFRRSISR